MVQLTYLAVFLLAGQAFAGIVKRQQTPEQCREDCAVLATIADPSSATSLCNEAGATSVQTCVTCLSGAGTLTPEIQDGVDQLVAACQAAGSPIPSIIVGSGTGSPSNTEGAGESSASEPASQTGPTGPASSAPPTSAPAGPSSAPSGTSKPASSGSASRTTGATSSTPTKKSGALKAMAPSPAFMLLASAVFAMAF